MDEWLIGRRKGGRIDGKLHNGWMDGCARDGWAGRDSHVNGWMGG